MTENRRLTADFTIQKWLKILTKLLYFERGFEAKNAPILI
jgi:hypothetical protein